MSGPGKSTLLYSKSHLSLVHSRLAPTPSGLLHIGNVYNFILTYWYVRSQKGMLSLRIDDSDQGRVRDQYIDNIFETLQFLDLDYDRGPKNTLDFKGNFSQQKKTSEYFSLLEMSDNLFSCDCTRKSWEGFSHYPGTCLDLNKSFKKSIHALRLNDGERFPVLWKKDNTPSYHLCSIKDDIDLGITHIIRGLDLLEIGLEQKRIAEVLNLDFKIDIFHHKLLTDQGRKISKTQKDKGIFDQFHSKKEVFDYLVPFLKTAPFDNLKELSKREFNPLILLPT